MKVFNKNSTKYNRKKLRENQTETEAIIWNRLRNRQLLGCKFFRQYGIGKYIVDFYCPKRKLVIEIDGNQHYLTDGIKYDEIRTSFFNSMGIKVIRFKNMEVLVEIDEVVEKIRAELTPDPSL